MCSGCNAFIKKGSCFTKHKSTCFLQMKATLPKPLAITPYEVSETLQGLLSKLQKGPESDEILNNKLIQKYGDIRIANSITRHFVSKFNAFCVQLKDEMRRIAKVFINIRQLRNENEKSFKNCYLIDGTDNENDNILPDIRDAIEASSNSPNVQNRTYFVIKKFIKLLHSNANHGLQFLTDLQRVCNNFVVAFKVEEMKTHKRKRHDVLPDMSEIRNLYSYISNKLATYNYYIKEKKLHLICYTTMRHCLVTRLISYNAARGAEVCSMTITEFKTTVEKQFKIPETLTTKGYKRAQKFFILETVSKGTITPNSIVDVYIPRAYLPCIKYLINPKIRAIVKVSVGNIFVFPKLNNSDKPCVGSAEFTSIQRARGSNVKITCNTFRHLKTSNAKNKTIVEKRAIAVGLGHSTDIAATRYTNSTIYDQLTGIYGDHLENEESLIG